MSDEPILPTLSYADTPVLSLPIHCSNYFSVDRDGLQNDFGRQGLDVYIGNRLKLHFEDENDANYTLKTKTTPFV